MTGRVVADLRLVPAAVTGWAVVLAVLVLGWSVAVVVGFVGVGIALWSARPRSVIRGGWLAVGAVAAATALVVGAHAWQVEHHPLRDAADRGSVVTADVTLTDDPRPVRGGPAYGGGGDRAERVVASGRVESVTIRGVPWRVGGRVVLLADADGWNGLLPGQRLRVTARAAPADGVDLTVAVLRVSGAPEVVNGPSRAQRAAQVPRTALRDAASVLDPGPGGLLPAIVVGDVSRMTPEVRDDFRAAGLSHLSAVSGANFAILVGAVLGLARLCRAGPRTASVIALVALVALVVVCRPSPSVLRAAVMGSVTLLALLLGRHRSAMPALGAAVIGLLLVDPELGVDAGFALSVLATGALVLLAPPWTAALRERGVPPGCAEAITIPVAAHVVTAPVVAAISAELSLVAVLANLLAAPAVAPATVLGALTAVVGSAHPGAGAVVAHVAGPFVGWLVGVGHHLAAVPDATVGWPGGWRGGLVLAGLTVAVLVALRAPRFRVLVAAVVVGALLVLVPTRYVGPGWPAAGWAVVACDVAQGDALVLATADPGRAVLVDVGAEPAPVDECLRRLGVDRLALVVLTHLHADHIGGLDGALRGRTVGAVAIGPGRSPPWALDRVRRQAGVARAPLVELTAGRRLTLPGLTLDVLGPQQVPTQVSDDSAEVDGTTVNDASVVVLAHTGAGRVLLTGDIELAAQADLLASGVDLRADVLKVPHHGSRYTSAEFLRAVRPRVALISVGADNTYGHPSSEVTDTLNGLGARVLRTDQQGDTAVLPGPATVGRGAGS